MLSRMASVARTEIRFGFRRGWPVVGTVAVVLVVSAFALYVGYMMARDMPQGMPKEVFREYAPTAGALGLAGAWPVFEWLALVILPIVTAQAIEQLKHSVNLSQDCKQLLRQSASISKELGATMVLVTNLF